MSYQNYVIAAYAVFVAGMLWDWLSPKLQIRQQLRAAALRVGRAASKSTIARPSGPDPQRDPS